MAVDVPGGILKQSDVRETITNTEETGVLFNLDFSRFENKKIVSKNINGLFVAPDGVNIYIVYDQAGASTVAQWTFGTKWDITTITENGTLDVDSEDTLMTSVFFKHDGTKMFLTGQTGSNIYEYDLSTPWLVTSAILGNTKAIGAACAGLYFREDGKRFFHGQSTGTDLKTFNMTTPWDTSTAEQVVNDGVQISLDHWFSKDGLRLFMVNNDEIVDVYPLTQPFIPASKGTVANFTMAPKKDIRGITLSPNGSIMYVGNDDEDSIQQFTIKRGWR